MSDRKYKQRGYMDGEGERKTSGSAPPRPPRDPREAPRGRGLGAPTESAFRCARCGASATVAEAMSAAARCAGCGSDLHTCTNCTSFDPASPHECRQPMPERIAKKDRANSCELYAPRVRQEHAPEKPAPAPDDPRAAFDALFKF